MSGARPEIFTETLIVEGAAPLDASSESQACVFVAVQSIVPLPLLVTLMACDAGLLPPAIALKVREGLLVDNTGVDDLTGIKAIDSGTLPTGIVVATALVAVAMTETLLSGPTT